MADAIIIVPVSAVQPEITKDPIDETIQLDLTKINGSPSTLFSKKYIDAKSVSATYNGGIANIGSGTTSNMGTVHLNSDGVLIWQWTDGSYNWMRLKGYFIETTGEVKFDFESAIGRISGTPSVNLRISF